MPVTGVLKLPPAPLLEAATESSPVGGGADMVIGMLLRKGSKGLFQVVRGQRETYEIGLTIVEEMKELSVEDMSL